MSEQLVLHLSPTGSVAPEDYYVSDANAVARKTLDDWQGWLGGKLLLLGPEAAGKTHLTRIWAEAARARILPARALAEAPHAANLCLSQGESRPNVAVEDVPDLAGDPCGEEALLHLHNLVLAEGGRLLMTGRGQPHLWGIRLPDLASRLEGTQAVGLAQPDDPLVAALLLKHFDDRGIAVSPALVAWLVPRIERSFAGILDTVARLDEAALSQSRKLGRKLAAEVLGADVPAKS